MRGVLFVSLVACGSPVKPDVAVIPPPTSPTNAPREVSAAQFAAAMESVFEASADASCACKDDGCRQQAGARLAVWMRDIGAENEMKPELAKLDACWKDRLDLAWKRVNTGACTPVTKPACKVVPVPAPAMVETWWTSPTSCPLDSRLELTELAPGKPWKAQCLDGNGNRGRFTQWHLNGSVMIDGAYSDHQRDGTWRAYYVHGQLAWERSYARGQIEGDHTAFFPNGAPMVRGRLRGGLKYGPQTTWPVDGNPTVQYFEDDKEVDAAYWEATGAKKVCTSDCIDDRKARVTAEYSVSAEKNFERGKAALASNQHELAALYFLFVRSRFPYSKYSQLSEQALVGDGVEYGRLRSACVTSCNRCAATCKVEGPVVGDCRQNCTVRFPDPAKLPAAGT